MIDLFFFMKRERERLYFSCLVYHKIIFFSCRKGLLPVLLPHLGIKFGTIEEASMFWVIYEGQKGFEVRKRYTNTSLQQSKA
jgi:hypothetical protein